MLAVFQQPHAIDDDMIDPGGDRLDARTTVRKVVHQLARLVRDGLGIEDGDVGHHPRGDEAAIVEVVHPRGLAGEPMDRLFQRHHLLFAHPVTQQSGAVVIAVMRMRTRAAIAGPDHGIVRAEDLLLRLRIGAALDDLEQGVQVLVDGQVEEGIDRALALLLGDVLDALALERLVLLLGGQIDLHEVPAPVEIAARLPRRSVIGAAWATVPSTASALSALRVAGARKAAIRARYGRDMTSSHVGIPWKMPFGFVKSSSCGTSSPSRRSKIGP